MLTEVKMPEINTGKGFWQFNLGHFLNLVTIALGGIGVYVQLLSSLQDHEARLRVLERAIPVAADFRMNQLEKTNERQIVANEEMMKMIREVREAIFELRGQSRGQVR